MVCAMRVNQIIISLLAVVLFAQFAQAGEPSFSPKTAIRKSVDADGRVIFSKSGFDNSSRRNKPKVIETVKPVPAKPTAPKVDIYYAGWDPYSNKAILFFRDNHIVVNAYDIDLDAEAAARKKKIDPAFVGMPLVIINGIVIRGVDEKKYQEALDTIPK